MDVEHNIVQLSHLLLERSKRWIMSVLQHSNLGGVDKSKKLKEVALNHWLGLKSRVIANDHLPNDFLVLYLICHTCLKLNHGKASSGGLSFILQTQRLKRGQSD